MVTGSLDLSKYENKRYLFKTEFSKLDIAFFRYSHILCLLVWLFFLIMEMFFFGPDFQKPKLSFELALPLLATATLSGFAYLKNKVFRIIFTETEIVFFFFLKKNPITCKIRDLVKVRNRPSIPLLGDALIINGANIFEFSNGRKLVIHPDWATRDNKDSYFDFMKKTGLLTD